MPCFLLTLGTCIRYSFPWMLFPSLFTSFLSSRVTARLNRPGRGSQPLQCIPLLHSWSSLLLQLLDWRPSASLDHAFHKGVLFLFILISISLAESWCSLNTCKISPKVVWGRRNVANEFHLGKRAAVLIGWKASELFITSLKKDLRSQGLKSPSGNSRRPGTEWGHHLAEQAWQAKKKGDRNMLRVQSSRNNLGKSSRSKSNVKVSTILRTPWPAHRLSTKITNDNS